jgi:methylglutaconyl-CoA hydratase
MKYIEINTSERITEITLNRPEKRNALNPGLVSELKEAFTTLRDDEGTRVIILKARGKAFSAGADLEYLQSLQSNTYAENLEDSNRLKELFSLIYNHPKITIAQVEGAALAGGCGLATVCDFTYSIPDAQFGYTEVKIGFIPAIVMMFLLRKIGEASARRMLLTGELFTAEAVLQMGLITAVVPAPEIDEKVRTVALKLSTSTSPQSITLTKNMIAEVQSMPWKEALDFAAGQNAAARTTEDCKRGIAAFLNKKSLKW